MTINMSAYVNLRDTVVSGCTPCMEQNLQCLRVHFTNIINSTRREEYLRNVGDLVRILEKRNALNVQNLESLKDIARLCNRQDLLELLENGLERRVIVDIPPLPAPPVQQRHSQAAPRSPVLSPPAPDYHQRVYQLVIEQIGNKWKEFARHLGISEGKIDELQQRYHLEPSERVREILNYHERSSPPQEVWTRLMDALSNSRRKDLSIEVQRILIGN